MRNGTVKFYNEEKGYGFITPSDGSKDVFFHVKTINRCLPHGTILKSGDVVYFEEETTRKGVEASEIEL